MSIRAFQLFIKNSIVAQAIHREDLGDESRSGSVTGGLSASTIALAPHLAKQQSMELGGPTVQRGYTPPGMGLGSKGGNNNVIIPQRPRKGGNQDD